MASDDPPTLDAHEIRSIAEPQLVAWCPWCEAMHRHGVGDGHRVAHCHDKTSPLKDSGYILRCVGIVDFEDGITPEEPDLYFQSPFRVALAEEAKAFRSTLLRAMFGLSVGKSRRFCFTHDLGGGFRAVIIDRHWIIERPGQRQVEGDGLLTLAMRIYGVSAGAAAVRILEAALGECFDAAGAVELAAAVDAWHARGALSRIAKP